jgi:hypothetical protein
MSQKMQNANLFIKNNPHEAFNNHIIKGDGKKSAAPYAECYALNNSYIEAGEFEKY